MVDTVETENTAEGTQEDSIEVLEQEYQDIFGRLKTAYQVFVTEYIKTLNAGKSASAAGYSKNSSYKQGVRLCRNQHISQCVTLQQRINSIKGKVTTAWILKELKTRYDACVIAGRDQSAIRCLELIGQHLGTFGKGKDKRSLHLHNHKYVNYPPVPESIQAWVQQMREVGYTAKLPVGSDTTALTEEGKDETDTPMEAIEDDTHTTEGEHDAEVERVDEEQTGVTPIGGANRHA